MFIRQLRISNSISEILESEKYLDNIKLFDKGIEILKKYYNNTEDFNDKEREILEEIYTIMEE